MVFSLKSVNLELMSKEDVNQIPQSVDTHLKLYAVFFFEVSLSRLGVLIIYRTTGNLPGYG